MQLADSANKRHLLLGNGFSIALKPDIFTYGSLYENADFSAAPRVPRLFDALHTKDFEIVIRHLQDAAVVVEVYRPNLVRLASALRQDASAIKDALVAAVAKRHPDRPYDVSPTQYGACRRFLSRFDHIFTLNYDVLLYWALMQDEVDDLALRPDDGFRHPEDDPDLPYVSMAAGARSYGLLSPRCSAPFRSWDRDHEMNMVKNRQSHSGPNPGGSRRGPVSPFRRGGNDRQQTRAHST
jgi:hypothetical protein